MGMAAKNRLDPQTLIAAYTQGYFPMPDPSDESEILWFNPDPRAIIPLDGFHCSKSLQRQLRKGEFSFTLDQDFRGVLSGCADRQETWISEEIQTAYHRLHQLGFAHSVEVWADGSLQGGVYGVSLRGAFFAESMFHRRANASKIALYFLVEHLRKCGFRMLEVQFLTPHLRTLGAMEIPRTLFLQRLGEALQTDASFL